MNKDGVNSDLRPARYMFFFSKGQFQGVWRAFILPFWFLQFVSVVESQKNGESLRRNNFAIPVEAMRGSDHPSTADLKMRGTFPSYYKSKRWSVLREGLTFVKTYEWAAALRFYAFLSPVIFLNQGYKPREGIFLESQNRKPLFFWLISHRCFSAPDYPGSSQVASLPTTTASIAIDCRSRKTGDCEVRRILWEERLIRCLPGKIIPVKPLNAWSLGAIGEKPSEGEDLLPQSQ